ncbi:hypothetical protein [Embleya sp. NPDC001921]
MGDFVVWMSAGREADACWIKATGQRSRTIDSYLRAVFGFDDPERIRQACGSG